jgi:membrane-associated protease RseP (regulator of RpoE activity)
VDEYVPLEAEPAIAAERPYVADRPRRRLKLPLILFLLTCLSTFFTGGAWSEPVGAYDYRYHFNWQDGLAYMLGVMAILLAHEMGHFLQAVRHRVPASLPYFIPMPLSPIGTMGAVIGMQGSRADRRQLFDIGISGPLAGLVVAVPLAWYGVKTAVPGEPTGLDAMDPWLFRLLIERFRPDVPLDTVFAWNPYYMAAWFGMLITGVNMLPLSELDGGHVAYALFGKRAHTLARAVVLAVVAFIFFQEQYGWMLMLALVFLIGIDHPPTSNDRAELGWARRVIGVASLAIPVLCLAPVPFREG